MTTLLCMSDEEATVALVQEVFRERLTVVASTDQIEVLEIIRLQNPAAVIFDMRPQHFMAGLEALHMQCEAQQVPLIAVAPNRQVAAFARAVSSRLLQCVVKPLSIDKLNACLPGHTDGANKSALRWGIV